MTVINTNTAASITANALTKNERAMSQAMERLSTGQRINNAGDDAAGLAISSKMTSQVNGLNMAVRNANDAISMIQTVDGAASQVETMLQRMRELAVQAASGTMTTSDVTATNTEFQQLLTQINDIADDTTWNGVAVMSGGSAVGDYGKFSFQVGANASQTIDVNFGDWNTAASATATAFSTGSAANDSLGRDISAYTSSSTSVITNLDSTIADVNTARATYGAVINRLEYAVDNLSNTSQNVSASRSRVLDADYAAETTELARTQIIQQAATAMLSQANQQAQSVLALLK